MLTYLDTAIGLAVILLGISLLITILTQMTSALVSYRRSNLRWGLETLFEQIDPTAFTALLSLGAPFWFNALKRLTNLRPIVASKQKAENRGRGVRHC
jgi:hypothetical protein